MCLFLTRKNESLIMNHLEQFAPSKSDKLLGSMHFLELVRFIRGILNGHRSEVGPAGA